MNIPFPPISEVRAELEALGHAEVQELSRLSTVPFTTLWKIRDGTTKNPGIETVRLFYPLIGKFKNPTTEPEKGTPEAHAEQGGEEQLVPFRSADAVRRHDNRRLRDMPTEFDSRAKE